MATARPAVDTHAHHEQESSNPTQIHNCPRKRIIVACDGTWMDSDGVDQVPSNITRIVRAIPPVGVDHTGPQPKPITQVTFYQNGIGTGYGGWYQQYIGKYVSGATGEGLAFNIREAYNFICSNYHRDDEVILLGFSRGAFTARSISTLIRQLGLLTPKGLSHLVEITDDWEHQMNKDYKSPYPDEPFPNRPSFSTKEYHKTLHDLKMTRQNISIKCVAVWDTVGALGLPTIALFPQPAAKEFAFVDTRVEDNIEYAFHALGLDEKRRSYAPSIWFKPPEQKFPKVLKQTWFPGVHSDIGGSYANDDIANLTLAWMVGQLEENQLVTFNRDYIVRQVHRTIKLHAEETKELSRNHSYSLERAKTFGPLRKWGLGKIHDSYTLFFRIGGQRTRTPMEHPEVSRKTMEPTGRLLQGTNERMHASVRVRMALGGRGYDDNGEYISEALKHWEYTYGRRAQPDTPFQVQQPGEVGKLKDVEWVKTVTKNGKTEEVARMIEDQMTEFERLILRHWTDAEDNWEEGADERESEVDTARPTARESSRFWETPKSARKSADETKSWATGARTRYVPASDGMAEKADVASRIFATAFDWLQRVLRPSVKPGMRRIAWTCSCGDDLYADFEATGNDTAWQVFVTQLQSQCPTPRNNPGTTTARTGALPGVPQQAYLGAFQGSTSRSSGISSETSRNIDPASEPSQGVVTIGTQQLESKRKYLNICLPSHGRLHKLDEVDVSGWAGIAPTDRIVFDHIRLVYHRNRKGYKLFGRFALYQPKVGHFVKFVIHDSPLVDVLQSRPSLPPKKEVTAGRYAYDPVPMCPLPPMQANTFVHFLTKRTHMHNQELWVKKFPYRLNLSLRDNGTPQEVGWGIEIEEGPNMLLFSLISLALVLSNGLVAGTYGALMKAPATGIAIGSWLTAVQALIVTVLFFRWTENAA